MKFHISKFFWSIRAFVYKPFTKSLKMPTYIGNPLFISGLNRIAFGKRVRIFPHVRLEAMKNGGIEFGNNVYIGQNCHITSEDSIIKIGDGTAVMANVCITNIDHVYIDPFKPVLEQGYETKLTTIGNNCFIGHGAVIQAGTQLGNHCIVGAGAVVKGFFPDNCVLVGIPAKIVKKYSFETKTWF